MRLLLDQNVSWRLCAALGDLYPGSSQVRLPELDRADDTAVWRRAAEDGYTLVTHDADFRDISAVRGAPPKVVLLRCGNQPTAVIERLLRTTRFGCSSWRRRRRCICWRSAKGP